MYLYANGLPFTFSLNRLQGDVMMFHTKIIFNLKIKRNNEKILSVRSKI